MVLKPDLQNIYKVVGNCKIAADIYLPKAASSATKFPVIINIHGGGFVLGHSDMVNKDQVQDCLDRGWIVVVPDHRLCPQVDIIEGPVQDIRDLLRWIYDGKLDQTLAKETSSGIQCDLDRVISFGTSAGGHLALCLGFDVEKPVAAILDFYGPCDFTKPFWTSTIPHLAEKIPKFPKEFLDKVYDEDPVATKGGMSLEGQSTGAPDFRDPRTAFAMSNIANGTLMEVCFPSKNWNKIDSICNIGPNFPPCCIVHGQSDTMVPITLSRDLYAVLKEHGVQCEMIEVPGEEHTFAGKMKRGSQTWDLQRKGFDFLESVLAK